MIVRASLFMVGPEYWPIMRVVQRVLTWDGCLNVRDLGGLPISGGGHTRQGVLIRADSLDRLSAQGLETVGTAGVARIVDLRSPWELPADPHPFHGDRMYRQVCFIDETRDHERDREAEHTLADLYRGSLDRNGHQVAAAVAEIVDATEGAVIVHCSAGKDRTGMLVAVLLDAVGVLRTAIAEDYAASESAVRAMDAARPMDPGDKAQGMRRPQMRTAWPETILETLDHLDSRYGGSTGYLTMNGVTASQLESLRTRLAPALVHRKAISQRHVSDQRCE
jgi:protein tyrosine/serine phosphatase